MGLPWMSEKRASLIVFPTKSQHRYVATTRVTHLEKGDMFEWTESPDFRSKADPLQVSIAMFSGLDARTAYVTAVPGYPYVRTEQVSATKWSASASLSIPVMIETTVMALK